jgi:hypothetical protein
MILINFLVMTYTLAAYILATVGSYALIKKYGSYNGWSEDRILAYGIGLSIVGMSAYACLLLSYLKPS